MASSVVTLEKINALCKRRGFAFQSAEIYGGLNGIYDIGPLGSALRSNLKNAWRTSVSSFEGETVFMEGALIGSSRMWEASGHVENFHDPMVDCLVCKHRYRTDEVDLQKNCPHCGNKNWSPVRQFHMMFSTNLGATVEQASEVYLRPETAQAIFVNFKNIYSTARVKIPFGVAQIGKAFRNEITPKQFLFRLREFEQMEIEWFCTPDSAARFFEEWKAARSAFYTKIGIKPENVRLRDHDAGELSHYSRGTTDIEYQFPFGWKELEGIANRGDFDLSQHSKFSGKDLSVFDEATKQSYVPHVVECSVGVDRLMLATLCDAYDEDVIDGESRVVLRFAPEIAPITAAFLPLTKHQTEATETIYKAIKKNHHAVVLDESGSIGKRYRRYDEIGTPYCITFDYDSGTDGCVTIRNRDTTVQERVSIDEISKYCNLSR
jgi:glycyl-tRNA synthetase